MIVNSSNWYLLQYKPNSMVKATLHLKRQGVDVFCPNIIQTYRRGTKFITKTSPLFPGYIFFNINNNLVSWKSINSTYGVNKIVSFGKFPCQVPIQIIQNLKKNCDQNNVIFNFSKLEIGDEIKFEKGPFTNLIGKILRIESNKRIWILLDYMNKKAKVTSNMEHLRKLN